MFVRGDIVPESLIMARKISTEETVFEEPALTFEEPEVKEIGDLTKVTKGFFGTFSP